MGKLEATLPINDLKKFLESRPTSEEERSERETQVLEKYVALVGLLKDDGLDVTRLPSTDVLKEQIRLAWSHHPQTQRNQAARRVIRLLGAATVATQTIEKSRTLAHDAKAKVLEAINNPPSGAERPKTTGQALKAVAKAYRRANATMSTRFEHAIASAKALRELETGEETGPGDRAAGAWGGFAVSLPYSPYDKTGAINKARRVISLRGPDIHDKRREVRDHAMPTHVLDQHTAPSVRTYTRKIEKKSIKGNNDE